MPEYNTVYRLQYTQVSQVSQVSFWEQNKHLVKRKKQFLTSMTQYLNSLLKLVTDGSTFDGNIYQHSHRILDLPLSLSCLLKAFNSLPQDISMK